MLPEDLYEEWTFQRRDSLRQLQLQVLLSLAKLLEERKDLAAGIETLQRVLAKDRLNEEAHTGLMRLYALSGQTQQALRQFQTLRETLKCQEQPLGGDRALQYARGLRTLAYFSLECGKNRPLTEIVAMLQESILLLHTHRPDAAKDLIISLLFLLLSQDLTHVESPERAELLALLEQENERFYFSEYLLCRGGHLIWENGDLEEAKWFMEESLKICREIGDSDGIIGPLLELGRCARWGEDFPGSAAHLREAIDMCRQIKHRMAEALCLSEYARPPC